MMFLYVKLYGFLSTHKIMVDKCSFDLMYLLTLICYIFPCRNCGEMAVQNPKYAMGPVCAEGAQIVYAWAMDAPNLKMPKGELI